MEDCSISSALAVETLQSCTKPSYYSRFIAWTNADELSTRSLEINFNDMMTSSNGNIFRVAGILCGEFTGHRWIPHTKASDAVLWCLFFICAWIKGWVNNREAGDLRRHRTQYDVTVMKFKTNHDFHSRKFISKRRLRTGGHFVRASMCVS